jgi:putative lipoic acid-binding regulatory protein
MAAISRLHDLDEHLGAEEIAVNQGEQTLPPDESRKERMSSETRPTLEEENPTPPPEPLQDPWQFPTRFPIKAMGLATEDIKGILVGILQAHDAAPHPDDLVWRQSEGGKYVSVTATIRATSKPQLEAIYLAMKAEPRIRYAL